MTSTAMTPTPKERVAVFLLGFAAFLPLYAPQSVLPQMADALGTSLAETGSVIGATTLAVALAAPVAGPLTDRFGRKRSMLIALALLGPLTLALVWCATLDQIRVARFVQGMVLPALLTGAVTYIGGRWAGVASAGIMGVFVGGSAMGGFVGRFAAGWFGEHYGWQAGFAALAVLSAACLPFVWRGLEADKPDTSVRLRLHLAAARQHLRDPNMGAVYAFGATVLFAMTGTLSYVGFHLAGPPFGMSSGDIGLMFLVYPVAASFAPLNGKLLKRLPVRAAAAVGCAICLTGQGLLLVPTIPMAALGICVFIAGIFLSQSMALGYVGRTARHSPGAAAGLYVSFFYFGGSLGSILPGLVWPAHGWTGAVALISGTILLGGVAAQFMRGQPRDSGEKPAAENPPQADAA